ncbi:sensor histidine kinase [Fibrivirga algicola]|uniref:histidine kinase n=1 Tax=Fibrivirga algicola TaxID=2950420 RepID=A0ABX0QHV3_9BACT|nr:ATP-binding protein [Fibrivirga algicola]ARK09558.1 histidine kinase [Fibrella sp. ES10-3-2-2]NID10438.1 histidine kinase [Fibrivirga algicola]
MLKSLDIYSQNNVMKIIVALNLLLVGTGSMLFTQRIITKLEAREEQYMRLYAKALAYAIQTADNQEDLNFIVTGIIETNENNAIPAIYADEHLEPAQYRNVEFPANLTADEKHDFLKAQIQEMRKNHSPIVVDLKDGEKGLIYYNNSLLLKQLNYFPFALLLTLVALGVLAYLSFSSARRAEQNRVWVGLAKETAHQLGTPLSSLLAWVDYMRTDPEHYEAEVTDEIEKDVQRLETITARFSSIGSIPTLKDENLDQVITQFTTYLARRISTKVKMTVESHLPTSLMVRINRLLFEWVIENICKNAVDAMGGVGELRIRLLPLPNDEVGIDITDTGKGMSKSSAAKVFSPGYSTKKRGWGLGLTLAKRIVEEYHNGRLFVKSSEVGKGTTFRIVLNREPGALPDVPVVRKKRPSLLTLRGPKKV